jgi:hypothetical protein
MFLDERRFWREPTEEEICQTLQLYQSTSSNVLEESLTGLLTLDMEEVSHSTSDEV